MKILKLLFLVSCLILSALKCAAQYKSAYKDFGVPDKEGKAFYEVIDSNLVKGKDKNQLYNAARKVFAILYNNSKDIIEIDDKQEGHIVAKGTLTFNHKIQLGIRETSTIKFSIDFHAKDNKFRLQCYDFSQHASSFQTFEPLERLLNQTPLYRRNFFASYNLTMNGFIEQFEKDLLSNINETDF